jgi:hypothetical protein
VTQKKGESENGEDRDGELEEKKKIVFEEPCSIRTLVSLTELFPDPLIPFKSISSLNCKLMMMSNSSIFSRK